MPENLTRREFLRAVGVAGAGVSLAAAAAGTPLAEAADVADTKPAKAPSRFWWVKGADKPTTEVDWKAMKRYDEWRTTRGSLRQYRGEKHDDEMTKMQGANLKKWEQEGKPGYTTKDRALQVAVGLGQAPISFLGPEKPNTPKDRGVARYEGSPEDNARIVTAALRHMGACKVGFVELDENTTMKLVYNQEPAPSKKSIVFENVDEGFEEKERLVIPKKARWVIVFNVQMSGETMKRGPTVLGSLTTGLTYTRMWDILFQLHGFLRALGWQSYGPSQFNGLGIYPAFAVMAGLGELSRLNRLITPEYGPMVRETILITDLPVAPTKPIEFGVMRFCQDCMICADMCPSKTLSFDRAPSWEVRGPWNNPGHRAYFENSVTCRNYWNMVGTNCGICFAVCPYAQEDKASIHSIWQATAAVTPALNGIIKRGSQAAYPAEFGGKPIKDPEAWWRNTNMAEYGIDTMEGGRTL